MSEPIITVEGLGKKYSLRHQSGERYTALRDIISARAAAPFRALGAKVGTWKSKNGSGPSDLPTSSRSHSSKEDFWALKDVSFEVKRGEVLGIIGRNGAGKSTLLKILSRITDPTEGRVKIKGRVASLLEVGTGFHPELTGRENIYLNGAILGMHRHEIKQKFDEIVAFAETEKFLDTPVKRNSSGMYLRLAFAVAAHLEPEILIVDEVLAVGDAEFQKKCLGKMQQVSGAGRTVLFVSHNMVAAQTLCTRGIVISEGRVICASDIGQCVSTYLSSISTRPTLDEVIALTDSLKLTIAGVDEPVQVGSDFSLTLTIFTSERDIIEDLELTLFGGAGIKVASFDLRPETGAVRLAENDCYTITIDAREIALVEGEYQIGIFVAANSGHKYIPDIHELLVIPSPKVENAMALREIQFRGICYIAHKVKHAFNFR
jgi:lipopolysaccharide transport system ATP-binding protein